MRLKTTLEARVTAKTTADPPAKTNESSGPPDAGPKEPVITDIG
jgi:hypothetical protein